MMHRKTTTRQTHGKNGETSRKMEETWRKHESARAKNHSQYVQACRNSFRMFQEDENMIKPFHHPRHGLGVAVKDSANGKA
jgi:quinol monooxygenase YgiN